MSDTVENRNDDTMELAKVVRETGAGKHEKVRTLTSLKAGEQPFAAWGYCDLKVSTIENDEMEEYIVRVPIKSTGITELMETISNEAVVNPPTTLRTIKKNSPEGQALGYKHDVVVRYIDEADEGYLKMREQQNQQAGWKIILHGLNMNLEDTDGTLLVKSNGINEPTQVYNAARAIEVLKQSGMSPDHLKELNKAITNLTKLQKENEDSE